MYVVITDEQTNQKASFYDGSDFDYKFGYEQRFAQAYDQHVSNTNCYFLRSHSGFYSNNQVNSVVTRGLGESGETLISQHLSAKQIVLNYNISIGKDPDQFNSNINSLNSLLTMLRPLKVEVYAPHGLYTNYFRVSEETNTEKGLIALVTAETGRGVLWSAGEASIKKEFFKTGIQYVPKLLPNVLLKKMDNPITISFQTNAESDVIYKFGCSKRLGQWNSLIINANGNIMKYRNDLNDDFIYIDTGEKKCFNMKGENRLDYLDVEVNKWADIIQGQNTISLNLNDAANWEDAQINVGQDFYAEFKFERLTHGIE